MVPAAAELLSIPSISPPLVAQPLSPKQIPADIAVETWEFWVRGRRTFSAWRIVFQVVQSSGSRGIGHLALLGSPQSEPTFYSEESAT
jgi:hypothetical protein